MRQKEKNTPATVLDVARVAGVSKTTVSRVINKDPKVKKATLEKVLQVMQDLNYLPNIAARRTRMTGRQSFLIGLICDNPSASYISDLLIGTLAGLDPLGYRLVVEEVRSSREGPRDRLPTILEREDIDGIILTPPICDDLSLVRAVEEAGYPVVRIVPFLEPERTPTVTMDDEGAIKCLVSHLVDRGHRKIAHITGDRTHGSAQARERGFRTALADHSLRSTDCFVIEGDYTFKAGMLATQTLLSQINKPSAIVAANDEMAAGCLMECVKQGYQVPQDIAIVGFDDLPMSGLIEPHITTIRQPLTEMARRAAEILVGLASGRDAPISGAKETLIPYELLVRESSDHTKPPQS